MRLILPALLLCAPLAVAQPYAVSYSTLFGGDGEDSVRDIVVDQCGCIYVVGGTSSAAFPATSGSADATHNGSMDAFAAKLDVVGNLVWCTFLGGPNYDRAYAVELDPQGNVIVAGRAGAGFPVTAGAFGASFMSVNETPHPKYGQQDGFVAKIAADGSGVLWASYFGNTEQDFVRDLDVDAAGAVFLVGFQTPGAAWAPAVAGALAGGFAGGGTDLVLAKIAADGSAVSWARPLGGSGEEWPEGSVRINQGGDAFVLSVTDSEGIATAGAYQAQHLGGPGSWDFFVSRVRGSDGALLWSSYLGGSGDEHIETHELELDPDGNPIIASGTTSADFPVTSGAFQSVYGGSGGTGTGANSNYPGDVVIARLSADGAQLLAATFLGGSFGEAAEGIAVDPLGNVYLTGGTYSLDLPETTDAAQPMPGGLAEAFAAKVSADFSTLLFATYLGGSLAESCRSAAVTPGGRFFIGGASKSNDWPIANALQPSYGGGSFDGTLASFDPASRPTSVTATFHDGTLGALEAQSGAYQVTGSALAASGNARFLVPDRVYGDGTAVLRAAFGGAPVGSSVGVLLHAASPATTPTASGAHFHVVAELVAPGSVKVRIRSGGGAVVATGGDVAVGASPFSFEAIVAGATIVGLVDGVPSVMHTHPSVAAAAGLTSVTAATPAGSPVAIEYVLVRADQDVVDATIDADGHVWLSLVQPDLYDTFVAGAWLFTVNGLAWDIAGFNAVWLPYFLALEGYDAHHCVFVCLTAPVPPGVFVGLSYLGSTEAAMSF